MDPLVEFETVADPSAATAGPAAGDGPSQTDPAAAPGTPAPDSAATVGEPDPSSAGATVPAPAAAPIDLSDPAVAELFESMVDQRLAPLTQYVQSQLVGTPETGTPGGELAAPVQLDPFSDDFGQQLTTLLATQQQQALQTMQQLVAQVTQPLNERMQAETVAEGNQRLEDILTDDIARNGEFPRMPGQTESKAQGLVRPLAESLFPEIAARFGSGPRAAEIAMTRAASVVREIVSEAQAWALESERNRTATLAGARTDIGAGAAGAQVVGEIRARNIDEGLSAVTARHAAALRGQ